MNSSPLHKSVYRPVLHWVYYNLNCNFSWTQSDPASREQKNTLEKTDPKHFLLNFLMITEQNSWYQILLFLPEELVTSVCFVSAAIKKNQTVKLEMQSMSWELPAAAVTELQIFWVELILSGERESFKID